MDLNLESRLLYMNWRLHTKDKYYKSLLNFEGQVFNIVPNRLPDRRT